MPYAIIAYRQRFAYGRNKRIWISPPGGLWLSAAFNWPKNICCGSLSLAVVEGLSLELENIGVPVQFKWPNDLFVGRRKLVGILPRLLIRGKSRSIAKIGIGLNVNNKVPINAINIAEILNLSVIELEEIISRVLRGFEWAMHYSTDREYIREAVEKRLIGLNNHFPWKGSLWRVIGLEINGALKLQRNNETDLCTHYV